MNEQKEAFSAGGTANYESKVTEQDRWLPIANVTQVMKTALPADAKIAKKAKECMQECVSEFISFIFSEASEKCQQQKRKTVTGEDILSAMESLGFENYAEALKIYLSKYQEQQTAPSRDRAVNAWGDHLLPKDEADSQVPKGEDQNDPDAVIDPAMYWEQL